MKFSARPLNPLNCKSACLIVPIFEGGKLSKVAQIINTASKGQIKQLLQRGDIEGKLGQSLVIPLVNGIQAERVLLVGCGKNGKLTTSQALSLCKHLAVLCKNKPYNSIALFLSELSIQEQNTAWLMQLLAQHYSLSGYRFEQLKSTKSSARNHIKQILVDCPDKSSSKTLNQALQTGQAMAEGMKVAKDLGNLPGNVCTPTYLAQQAKKWARQHSQLKTTILNEKRMAELKMNAILSVSRGSVEPAQFITMHYQGAAKSQKPHVLVGKGITFDSGGISLKPGAAMDEMKFDMCGAASVFGTLHTVLKLKLPINLICIVVASENMPNGNATKPGDVITSMSGQTIEVLNTDAEGRLVLCDALTYAQRFKPKTLIDIATLTGACVVALGGHAHGLYSNDDKLSRQLLEAGQQSEDKAWPMPLWEEYNQQLKSPFADMANIGGPGGGSVTAACFLSRFTQGQTWAHLDIAGTAWLKGANKGSTGKPVPLLSQYLINQSRPAKK